MGKSVRNEDQALNIEIEPIQESPQKNVNPKWDELSIRPTAPWRVLIPVLTDLKETVTRAIRKVGTSDECPHAYAVDFDRGWCLFPAAGQMQTIFPLEPFIKKTLENGSAV